MSSEGSREIEGARKRLAAAKTQVSSAKMMMDQAKAMLNSAQTLSNTADKELKDAEQFLSEIENRLKVIDIDDGDGNDDNDVINERSTNPNRATTDEDMLDHLTPNAISTIYNMATSSINTSFTPLLQVVLIKQLPPGSEELYKVSWKLE